MDNRSLYLRNKSMLVRHKSRKGNQSMKNIETSRTKYSAVDERKQERNKRVDERTRQRYRKAMGFTRNGRKRRRKR